MRIGFFVAKLTQLASWRASLKFKGVSSDCRRKKVLRALVVGLSRRAILQLVSLSRGKQGERERKFSHEVGMMGLERARLISCMSFAAELTCRERASTILIQPEH